MLDERRITREQTPKRNLDMLEYQPRKLVPQNKIELGLPRNSWKPYRDTTTHEIYPIPEDEGEGGSGQQCTPTSNKETKYTKRKNHRIKQGLRTTLKRRSECRK